MPTPLVALTIAGVDSAGGAGVHADLRAFVAHGLHGATAVAALTAQSTVGIEAVHIVPADFVAAQVRAVTGDLRVRATKTGFLATADTVRAVAGLAAEGALPHLVVDPVLVRATGDRMFDADVEAAYLTDLLPRAAVLTPNRVEAGLLVGSPLRTVADMEAAAVELSQRFDALAVVKGGDADDEGDRAVDVVARAGAVVDRLDLPRVATANDHGSGCSFAAAIAAGLATGQDPVAAAGAAKLFVHAGLLAAADWRLGAGHGPIDPFAAVDRFAWSFGAH